MIQNKWGCFPSWRPVTEWHENNEDMVLIASFVFLRPAAADRPAQVWIAREGLQFDGESKRWWMASVMKGRYEGPGRLAAVIHDEYCARGRDEQSSPYSSDEVHRVYYEAARCAGLPAWRAEARWFGVRKFGPRFDAAPGVATYTLEDLRTVAPEAYAQLYLVDLLALGFV